MINPAIFREYDIRGIVGEDLDEERMELLGRAFGTFIRSKGEGKVVVGRDNRKSSLPFSGALERGLISSGVDVFDVGEITTPCLIFATRHLRVSAGLCVTASHNPEKFNGLKFVFGGRDVGGEGFKQVLGIIDRGQFSSGSGRLERVDIFDEYMNALREGITLTKKFRVVTDTGNGIVGKFVVPYLRSLGVEVIPINEVPDSTYPNHPPDTVKPEYYGQLISSVIANKADIGLIFDGDGDRIAGVDERGKIVWADMFLLLYARQILKKRPGSKIVVEIKCSESIMDDIRNHGGTPILWKTGRTNIEDKLFEVGGVLSGEMSGHMFFLDGPVPWLSESLYAAGRILQIIEEEGTPFSELLKDVPKYHSSQEFRPRYSGNPETRKFELMKKIVADFKREWGENVLDIDGARVVFPGKGWGLVRVSNGEPVFSMRFEGKTEQDLQEILTVFRERLAAYPEIERMF